MTRTSLGFALIVPVLFQLPSTLDVPCARIARSLAPSSWLRVVAREIECSEYPNRATRT